MKTGCSIILDSLITVDPGIRKCGFAIHRNFELVDAGYVIADNVGDAQFLHTAQEVLKAIEKCEGVEGYNFFVEQMHARSTKQSAWENLSEISRMTGALLVLATVAGHKPGMVSPNIWTGRLPKAEHQERTKKLLTPAEEVVIQRVLDGTPAEAHSEVIDAVGMGQYLLGRV